jgi:hypothetical protein
MRYPVLLACVFFMPLVAFAGPLSTPAPSAPAFDLPLIGDQGYLRSADLFSFYQHTFLVFWDSGCPHCVESLVECEEFFDQHGGENITVVGIQTGQSDPFEVEQLLETNEIRARQLWDIGGETARAYSIAPATVTVVLVDHDGRIVDRRSPSDGKFNEVMLRMMRDADASSPASAPEDPAVAADGEGASTSWAPGFVFRGDERLRFLSIDSRGEDPVGPYGESLEKGNTVLYRFDLEVSRRITRNLRVGGLLRIGNEDEKVLRVGPEYLGSRWGSAFAEIGAGRFTARLGYYPISMTPLALMRWDWDDNPRIGGNAGCGCGAAAGVLLVESLEELDAGLVFEGGTIDYRIWDLDLRAFYAIPRRANEITYDEYYQKRITGTEPAGYSLETCGGEARWRSADSRTGSAWSVGLRAVSTWEDDQSVDFIELGYPVPDPSTSSAIATTDWNIPVVRFVDLRGEWILFNQAKEDREAFGQASLTTRGKGGFAGLVFEHAPGWGMRLDYIYLDADFYSPFTALSYVPNRKGARVSAQVPLSGERVFASFFYKRLRETETPHPMAEKEQESYFGASLDAELRSGLGGSVGWLDTGTWRKGAYQPIDDVRKALVVGARYRFDRMTTVQIQYQWLERTRVERRIESQSTAGLYSVYLSTRF